MKFSQKKPVLSLLCLSLLAGSHADLVDMKPNFKEVRGYKNVVFGASVGGSSHINWVLSIGEELGIRGHNVTFLTTSDETKFGKPYSHIDTVEFGSTVYYDKVKFFRSFLSDKNIPRVMSKAIGLMATHYERDYAAFIDYFKNHDTDVALCDHFMEPCVDAATKLNIPYVITASMDLSKESAAPFINNGLDNMDDGTTEFQTFTQRFYNKFIQPYVSLYYFWPHIQNMLARKKALGLDVKMGPPDETWKHSIKLINNLFGFSAARPIGSLAEYIGPIIPKQYKPLTGDLKEYLDSHKNIAYIAFGQNAVPSEEDIAFILTGLIESLEAGYFDGFLWATVHASGLFPDTITTASGKTYNVSEMFDHSNPHARMIKWVPQTAVLMHSSTSLFVSHGGLGSWYESMYSGTPMVMFPFFGDQPGNALIIERSKLGGILKKDGSVQEAVDLYKRVAKDEKEEIKGNVERFQAMVQIYSEHGIMRGADVVEEVAYTHKDGKLPHRVPANVRMGYIKANNLDLYAALVAFVAIVLGLTFTGVRQLVSPGTKQKQIKLKTY